MYNTSFIKYFYLLIVFSILFVTMYNNVTDTTSFSFITGIQALYLVIFIFQLFQDNNITSRALIMDFPKTKFSSDEKIYIPLVWVILPGLVMQLISSINISILSSRLNEKYGKIKLPRNEQWNLNNYKWMFILATLSLMFLTYSYCVDFGTNTPMSGSYKTFMLIMFLSSIIIPIFNVINSNRLSKVIFSITE